MRRVKSTPITLVDVGLSSCSGIKRVTEIEILSSKR